MRRVRRWCPAAAALSALLSLPSPAAPGGVTPADIARHLGRRWYGVYFMDRKIGWAESEINRVTRGGAQGVRVRLALNARVAMQGAPQEMSIVEERVYLLGKGLDSFDDESSAGGTTMRISGRREGRKMRVSSVIGGETREELIDAPDERIEDYLAEERLVGKDAKVGDEISFTQYQPHSRQAVTAVSRIAGIDERPLRGVRTKVYAVETTLKEMGIVSKSILTADGEVLQSQIGGAFTMRLEDEKSAKCIDYRSDVIISSAIRPGKRIADSGRVRAMRAVVKGVADRALLIDSDRQKYEPRPDGSALLTVRVEAPAGERAARIPMRRGDFPDALGPGPFVQSESREIVEKAGEIVGDERDDLKASDRIVSWVYRNLKKRYSAAFSNALDVLRTRAGDCTEHSVLYVALARAAGLPAREVSGIVYSDDGFYYHQWAEAYTGKWIAVDPTFGQGQADATHVKFASGDLLSQARLLNLIGALSIEILDYSYDGKR